MPDIELTQDYLGGLVRTGDCGHIVTENSDGTVNVVITRRECDSLTPTIPVPFVDREHLQPCHCDE